MAKHGQHKLSIPQVLQIIQDDRRPLRLIASDYGVTIAMISAIKQGVVYPELPRKIRAA